jgi:inorganic pyrophosphatase
MPAMYGGVDFEGLPTRDQQGALRAVIETPRGSVAKLKYDPDLGVFRLERPLAVGIAYPYDWGFFPSTRAADGDPLDVMVVHDATSHPGLVIPCRPLGVLQVTQKRKVGAGRERNDRILAVPVREYRRASEAILAPRLRRELEQFFRCAVLLEGKAIRFEGWAGPDKADALIRAAESAYRNRETPPKQARRPVASARARGRT